jgi:hypothetical protein
MEWRTADDDQLEASSDRDRTGNLPRCIALHGLYAHRSGPLESAEPGNHLGSFILRRGQANVKPIEAERFR